LVSNSYINWDLWCRDVEVMPYKRLIKEVRVCEAGAE